MSGHFCFLFPTLKKLFFEVLLKTNERLSNARLMYGFKNCTFQILLNLNVTTAFEYHGFNLIHG